MYYTCIAEPFIGSFRIIPPAEKYRPLNVSCVTGFIVLKIKSHLRKILSECQSAWIREKRRFTRCLTLLQDNCMASMRKSLRYLNMTQQILIRNEPNYCTYMYTDYLIMYWFIPYKLVSFKIRLFPYICINIVYVYHS